jgi:Mg-chelatase subunit ChlD
MGAAMDEVISDAFDKDLTKRPVSVLVLTAGRPNDADELDATLKKTVNRLAESCDTCPLSITFVQIGDHPKATEYLSHLDDNIQAESASSGETFDLVDTIKDAEIQAAMSEIKGTKSSGKNGALIGACTLHFFSCCCFFFFCCHHTIIYQNNVNLTLSFVFILVIITL